MSREIVITPVLNGWICRVGCQSVVFTSKAEMLKGLDEYYTYGKEQEVEAKWLRAGLNDLGRGPECIRTPEPPVNACGAQVESPSRR